MENLNDLIRNDRSRYWCHLVPKTKRPREAVKIFLKTLQLFSEKPLLFPVVCYPVAECCGDADFELCTAGIISRLLCCYCASDYGEYIFVVLDVLCLNIFSVKTSG